MSEVGVIKRTELLDEILAVINDGHWCALIAPPGSGKTTLATQLVDTVQERHKSWCVSFVAFKESSTLEVAWKQVLMNWGYEEEELERWLSIPIADGLRSRFKTSHNEVCVILDDLDQLPTEVLRLLAAEFRRFWDRRRESEAFQHLHLVLFGGMELHYLTVGSYSPLSNVMKQIRIPDLSAEQSGQSLVLRLALDSLDPSTEEALFRETAGHPSLVVAIEKMLQVTGQKPTAGTIEAAARKWGDECIYGEEADNSFMETIGFMQTQRSSYATVIRLLASNETIRAGGWDDEVLMCGAIDVRDGHYVFRGRMIAEALRRYLDTVRMADYWCLHGDWDKARELYSSVSAEEIRTRRWGVKGTSDREILDLCLGITPTALEWSEEQAERFTAELGRYFFGADKSALWRLDADEESAVLCAAYPAITESQSYEQMEGIATQAARHHMLSTLVHNRGLVQGIGATIGGTRWAFALEFVHGIPSGNQVNPSLGYTEPSLFMVLERARQRELNQSRLRAQRHLIHTINLRLQRSTNLNEAFNAIVNGIQGDLHYECAQLSLVFADENLIRAVATNGRFDRIKHMTVRDLNGTDLLAQVYRTKTPCNVTDCTDPRFHCDPETIKITGFKSNAVLPLIDTEKVVGVLQVGDSSRTFAFKQADLDLLQPLANCAAIAIGLAREREAFELGFNAAGNAMAIIDSSGKVVSCNPAYSEFFDVAVGASSPLSSAPNGTGEPLVRVAFQEGHPFHTIRDHNGRKCEVTVVSVKDAFNRFAGGVEMVRTTGPMQGLTEALSEILRLTEQKALEQAIVDCICDHLGYPRVRLYIYDVRKDVLISRYSRGLDIERSTRFCAAEIIQGRSGSDAPSNFAACALGQPLIFLLKSLTQEKLPTHQVAIDSSFRRIYIVDGGEEQFEEELDKLDVSEWLDVPLISGGELLGKLTIDLKGTKRKFGLEDIELLGLFGHWASEALCKVLSLERARHEAELVQVVGLVGRDQGLEGLAWDFLVNITMEGTPGFNRALMFLKQPQTGCLQGFCCHGAANGEEWRNAVGSVQLQGSRREFLEAARLNRSESTAPSSVEARLRELRLEEKDAANPFVQASKDHRTILLTNAQDCLKWLYEALGWQSAEHALICPLVHERECEGLLYVDRAFVNPSSRIISESQRELVETLSNHFAANARTFRLGRYLQEQILGLSHKLISPMSSVSELAETMRRALTEEERLLCLDYIVAEAKRSVHTARTLLRAASGTPISPVFRRIDLVDLLQKRLAPYFTLLRADGFAPRIEVPSLPVEIEGDPDLLGDAFAELADNARTALLAGDETSSEAQFVVACRLNHGEAVCRVSFTNSGAPIPQDLRDRIFERFVSGTGSTGLGLPFVKALIETHRGEILFKSTSENHCRFEVLLPLRNR